MKKRIFDIIQVGKNGDLPSRCFDIFIVISIFANISCMFLETFEQLSPYAGTLKIIELVTLVIFILEYVLRVWTADILYEKEGFFKSRIKFICSFEGIVDLLTILPFFYLSGFVAFRMLRVVRIFRLFMINSKYDSFNVITGVLYEKKDQIFSSLFIIIILMMASSLGIYSAEHEAQPEAFDNAFSGIWWSTAALLTIGYGDITPITFMGRVMAIITAFLGVGVVAIPTGIISAGFVEQYSKKKYEDMSVTDIGEIGEILIDKGHEYIGRFISEVYEKYEVKVMIVLRDDMTIVATSDLKIKEGDILVVQSDHMKKEISATQNSKDKGKVNKKRRG